ncbi:hypothetical protein FHL15_009053 [Xylaria flabelliformis]|uniref:Uncharacterized protein n=1 Tax=Xylaria flabelliformis TaxID=2512241 RepID=A0A553HQ94_9PEZI|nr:hypothetical protein FHL15_009053 [Xylaria flabelliformis]
MCFAEYLAYTCGHTSIAVNRPCPMTTHLHNNPCCPRPACRPFLGHTMCPSCERIQHARTVDIAEYEHRWMHERGACGCPVRFPGVLHPRIVQRSTAVAGENDMVGRPDAGCASGFFAGQQATQSGRDEGSAIPLYQEARFGERVEVAVRLPSLYAAEWTSDHAKLHESGQYEDDSPGVTYNLPPPNKVGIPLPPPATSSSRQTHAETSNHGSSPVNNIRNPYEHGKIPPGHVARWAMEGPPGSLLDEILGPLNHKASVYEGRPADIQTVHYPNDSIPIAGHPIVCGPFANSKGQLASIVDFQQPVTTIAGFPIGAGPEGQSHAGDFETCSPKSSTESSTEICSPVRMRRLSSEF